MRTFAARRTVLVIIFVLGGAILVPILLRQTSPDDKSLVVYCAHDSVFAESIIRRFEQDTGVTVHVRYDEEANKSLGLTNLLFAERAQPRCDVFWNNQTLGTIRLKKEGLLAECDASLFRRIPAEFKDPDHQWAGFAARLRVFIVNTERVRQPTEKTIEEALTADSLSSVAIAIPLFGTTLSHYAVLCDQMGLDGLKKWHQSLHDRGIREARGNGAVKDLVAEGACDFGFTDSDDAFAAIDDGKPVTMLPVRLANGKTICLPNSVAMIRNCPHPDEARRFIQFLLSEDVEIALANSASRQVPLGPVNQDRLPPEVVKLTAWADQGVSLVGAGEQDQEVLNWLSAEYTGR